MNSVVNPYLARIVVNPIVRSGRPCVRDTRITVQEILRWLASGATEEEILLDYPYLTNDDFKAVFAYAAQSGLAHSSIVISAWTTFESDNKSPT